MRYATILRAAVFTFVTVLTAPTYVQFADERVKGRQVGVETVKGVVTLRGKVDSDEAKIAAAFLPEGIEGVKSVRNDLHGSREDRWARRGRAQFGVHVQEQGGQDPGRGPRVGRAICPGGKRPEGR